MYLSTRIHTQHVIKEMVVDDGDVTLFVVATTYTQYTVEGSRLYTIYWNGSTGIEGIVCQPYEKEIHM